MTFFEPRSVNRSDRGLKKQKTREVESYAMNGRIRGSGMVFERREKSIRKLRSCFSDAGDVTFEPKIRLIFQVLALKMNAWNWLFMKDSQF